MDNNNYVVIMAGGIGSRFWPVSREAYPKQFLDILNTEETLLQATHNRFHQFIPSENIFVITAEPYAEIVEDQLPLLPSSNIIGEPQRKNTAACIAYMMFKLNKLNPHANVIIAPSDHIIENQEDFKKNCLQALNFTARNNSFVTLGIQPTAPNTGFGYIEYEEASADWSIHPVIRFTEKPDITQAKLFLERGSYLWNAGIFIWHSRVILNAFKEFMPFMFDLFASELDYLNAPNEKEVVKHIYENCESTSIDYAILEKARNVFVIPATFTWSDLGTWNSAWDKINKDDNQNANTSDNTLMIDTQDCIVHSADKKLVLLGGMEDIIVVDTSDVLLICKKDNEQKIKHYLDQVKESTGQRYL